MEYLGHVCRVSEGCLRNVREVSGRCLVGVWKVSGIFQRCLVGFMRSQDRSGPNGIHDPQCFGPKFFYLFFCPKFLLTQIFCPTIFLIQFFEVQDLCSILDFRDIFYLKYFRPSCWLHLGFSTKLKIWQVPTCKMEPRSGIIF